MTDDKTATVLIRERDHQFASILWKLWGRNLPAQFLPDDVTTDQLAAATMTCPTCGAAPETGCLTSSGRPVGPHAPRYRLTYAAVSAIMNDRENTIREEDDIDDVLNGNC